MAGVCSIDYNIAAADDFPPDMFFRKVQNKPLGWQFGERIRIASDRQDAAPLLTSSVDEQTAQSSGGAKNNDAGGRVPGHWDQ